MLTARGVLPEWQPASSLLRMIVVSELVARVGDGEGRTIGGPPQDYDILALSLLVWL